MDRSRLTGIRCSRSCYNCPSCTAPLAITPYAGKDEGYLKPSSPATSSEQYILQCQYCNWSSLEIDVQFGRATKITEQLAKLRKARVTSQRDSEGPASKKQALSHDEAFANLRSFYKDQLSESGDAQNPYGSSPYSSPANLARIMSLYGGLNHQALKKNREKPQPMREASQVGEGLVTFGLDEDPDYEVVQRMQSLGWDSTASEPQQLSTPTNNGARFTEDLWPAATQLRTRRGKRCKTCRQFIARPEPKVGSWRYKIRLLAMSHVPRLATQPLHAGAAVTRNLAFQTRLDVPQTEKLQPHQTKQFILTVRNPIFETVKITLATPAVTPGRVASRVTILCPSFTVGPAGELWDDALSSSQASTSDGGRKAAMASLTGSSEASADRQPEAGKIWEKTRNSTSVVLEVVPGSVKAAPSIVPKSAEELAAEELDEDDDVLEVPVYVRAEWEMEVKHGESGHLRREGDAKPGDRVKKELGYWVVLGIGTIADD